MIRSIFLLGAYTEATCVLDLDIPPSRLWIRSCKRSLRQSKYILQVQYPFPSHEKMLMAGIPGQVDILIRSARASRFVCSGTWPGTSTSKSKTFPSWKTSIVFRRDPWGLQGWWKSGTLPSETFVFVVAVSSGSLAEGISIVRDGGSRSASKKE